MKEPAQLSGGFYFGRMRLTMKHFLAGFLSFIIYSSVAVAQKGYGAGFYIDNNDVKHIGLIKHFVAKKWAEVYLKNDSVKGFNEFYFKPNKKNNRVRLSSVDAKMFVVGQDTFERHKIPRHFDLGAKRMGYDFFEILEKGKINLYIHHHPAYHQTDNFIPSENKGGWTEYTYIIEKGLDKVQIRKDDFLQRIFINKWVKPLISDDNTIYDKWVSKAYRFSDLPQMIEDYNYRAIGKEIKGEVLILRRNDKLDDVFVIQSEQSDIGSLVSSSLITIEVNDIYNFQVCIKEGRCGTFSGTSKSKTYIELYQLEENDQWFFKMIPEKEGLFYAQRIEFLMKKREKKNK